MNTFCEIRVLNPDQSGLRLWIKLNFDEFSNEPPKMAGSRYNLGKTVPKTGRCVGW
jgi:hypothetical protein